MDVNKVRDLVHVITSTVYIEDRSVSNVNLSVHLLVHLM